MFCSENLEFKKGIGSIQLIIRGVSSFNRTACLWPQPAPDPEQSLYKPLTPDRRAVTVIAA
jgi:hypothetical protein